MSTEVHPTAIIETGAELADAVTVGAYAYIGAQVKLGKGTAVMHHATVDGATTMGEENEVHPYAYIGGKSHDKKYNGGVQRIEIGDRNIFREYTTVHCATAENLLTQLGHDNLILAYSHIAHECQVGDHLVMSSHAALGGHVEVGNHGRFGQGRGTSCVGKCHEIFFGIDFNRFRFGRVIFYQVLKAMNSLTFIDLGCRDTHLLINTPQDAFTQELFQPGQVLVDAC